MDEMLLLQLLPQLMKMPEERLKYNAKKQELEDQRKLREYEFDERRRQDSLKRKAQKQEMKQKKTSYVSGSELYEFLVMYDRLSSFEKRKLLRQLSSSKAGACEEKMDKNFKRSKK